MPDIVPTNLIPPDPADQAAASAIDPRAGARQQAARDLVGPRPDQVDVRPHAPVSGATGLQDRLSALAASEIVDAASRGLTRIDEVLEQARGLLDRRAAGENIDDRLLDAAAQIMQVSQGAGARGVRPLAGGADIEFPDGPVPAVAVLGDESALVDINAFLPGHEAGPARESVERSRERIGQARARYEQTGRALDERLADIAGAHAPDGAPDAQRAVDLMGAAGAQAAHRIDRSRVAALLA